MATWIGEGVLQLPGRDYKKGETIPELDGETLKGLVAKGKVSLDVAVTEPVDPDEGEGEGETIPELDGETFETAAAGPKRGRK